jgi:opacity protein-like surface antigen
MRRSISATGLILLFALVAAAQDVPRMETFLGYSYVWFNSAARASPFSANGGDGQFVYNFNKWVGAVADLGAVHAGGIGGTDLDTTIANFLFGPRISLRTHRLRAYVQLLWGGAYAATSTSIRTDQTAFAMTAGGGLDMKVSKHVSFRPIALDYYFTRLQNFRTFTDNNQNGLRYSAGFNFTFGAQ